MGLLYVLLYNSNVATFTSCSRVSFLPFPCVCWMNYCRLDRKEITHDKNLLISLFSCGKFRENFTGAKEKGVRWCDITTSSWNFFSRNIFLLFASHKIELLLWKCQQIYCEICIRINLFTIRFFHLVCEWMKSSETK